MKAADVNLVTVLAAQVERYTALVAEPGRAPKHQARIEKWLAEFVDDLARARAAQ